MASKEITITEDQLAALVDKAVAKRLGGASRDEDGERELPLNRKDLSREHPVVRALVAIGAHVGMDLDPTNGYTPFESALAEMMGLKPGPGDTESEPTVEE